MLGHIGLSESYSTLVAKVSATTTAAIAAGRAIPKGVWKVPGTIQRLAQLMRVKTRRIARKVTFGLVWDNVNIGEKVAEQVMGRNSESKR